MLRASLIIGGTCGFLLVAYLIIASGAEYRRLAIEWNEAVGQQLTGAYAEAGADASPPPEVTNVACSSAPAGGYQPGDIIEVLAIGSTGCTASFDLGTLRLRIPMVEYARGSRTGVPDPRASSGCYRGAYIVTETDRVQAAPITVTLESPGGRARASSTNLEVTIAGRS